jgi:hypothetical protein
MILVNMEMTRIVPGRSGIGVFRLVGMGLGWPRDQMAGWRAPSVNNGDSMSIPTLNVTSHRDGAIDR